MSAFSIEGFQDFSKSQVEAATAFTTMMTKGLQEIATETADYSKQSMSASAEAVQRMFSAGSMETAMQIQTEYAKSAYDGLVAKTSKINEIFAKAAAEAFKPAQQAFSKAVAKAP